MLKVHDLAFSLPCSLCWKSSYHSNRHLCHHRYSPLPASFTLPCIIRFCLICYICTWNELLFNFCFLYASLQAARSYFWLPFSSLDRSQFFSFLTKSTWWIRFFCFKWIFTCPDIWFLFISNITDVEWFDYLNVLHFLSFWCYDWWLVFVLNWLKSWN